MAAMGSVNISNTFKFMLAEFSTFAQIENLGRIKWDELPLKHGDGEVVIDADETPSEKETLWQKIVNFLKIMAPHVGLNIILLSYIGIGATIFIFLEAENELSQRRDKLKQILQVYQLILNETSSICSNGPVNTSTVERRMRPLLSVLSRTHEYDDRFTRDDQMWTDSEESLTTKWTFASAVLYGLTVITSTGYDHLTPTTDAGRIFTVFFGLLGIPLMFITAADIGKFLSDIVIRFYGTMLSIISWVASVVDAIKDYIRGSDDESIDSREIRRKRKRRTTDGDSENEDEEERLQLPIYSYFALVIGYCSLGSLLFNAFEKGAIWSYIHGVFFSFNTITTIGLGNIRVKSNIYLAFTVAYVIIGLAVITASLDLCSSTLKRTFTKLHYFGRKIRGARKGFANMSDDIREAMKIIAALKKTRPSKDRITLEDLKRFLEVQEHLLRQPFVPYNVHIFKWIEDAYFDDNLSISKNQKTLQPLPNHEPFLVF
uniref:Potassium channel domain-containing protein n=1 Tax=Panagrolaimus sp. JU765 TaxID=591449 RepID=A0AC34QEE7_9BILA